MSETTTMTFSVASKCDECGEDEQAVDAIVRTRGFRLGPWEIQLWTWGKDVVCPDCDTARDGHEQALEAAYEAGQRDAGDEARAEFWRREAEDE